MGLTEIYVLYVMCMYMANLCQFHHLTFVTKYSRVPSEEIALLRYDAMMEIGREPLMFDTK